LRIDVANNSGTTTGILSRCKVCGKYFTWECPSRNVYYDIKKGKKKAKVEPEHCGSTVCRDFWRYHLEHQFKMATDFEYAVEKDENMAIKLHKHQYLKKIGFFK